MGAPRWDASAASHDSGAAYVFDDPGGGAPWTLTHTLAPAAPSSGALFGHDVATSGATVVAGAPHDAQGVGEVHVFTFQAGQPAPEVLTAPAAAAGTFFGRAVALDGDLLSVGALHESSLASSAGAAHLYRPLPGGWSLAHTLLRCGGAADDGLGESVDVDGGRIAVGIPGADTTEGASSVGAVSVWSTLAEDCPLAVDTPTVSLAAGSTQTFAIQPPSSCAGNLFLLLGSFSLFDNEPIGGVSFPLNLLDSYFAHTLLYPNTPPLANSFGVLVPGGSTASFTLPTGLSPNLIGTCVYHAYVVIALAGPHAPCASNAVPALILP